MGRYIGPACRLCRREEEKLYLKGTRCYSGKCALGRRSNFPGKHTRGYKKLSGYGLRMREKQKLKRIYGLLERQFLRYVRMAERKKGTAGANLLKLLECRLDNTVFRLGFALSRKEARQLVKHGHFRVNGRKVDIPSYLVSQGDVIEVKEKSRKLEKLKEALELSKERGCPSWLKLDAAGLKGTVTDLPQREEIGISVEERLIVEVYSR